MRMSYSHHVFQAVKAQVRIHLGRFQAAVAEKFLHYSHVHTLARQMRCKGMPQGVRADVFGHPGPEHRMVHNFLYPAHPESLTARVEKQPSKCLRVLPV